MVSIALGSRSELYLLRPCYHFNSSSCLTSGPRCMISCLWHTHNNASFMLELRSTSYIIYVYISLRRMSRTRCRLQAEIFYQLYQLQYQMDDNRQILEPDRLMCCVVKQESRHILQISPDLILEYESVRVESSKDLSTPPL